MDAPFERASLCYDKLPDGKTSSTRDSTSPNRLVGVLMKVRDQDRRRQQQLDQPPFHPLFS